MPELDRETELRRLFDRAAGMAGAEREDLVVGIADEMLRERLRALLAQDAGQTMAALQQPLVGAVAASRRVGPYELLRVLGSGGMGVVVLARQFEPLERLVAVKFVADVTEGSEVLERFRAEQKALGRMNHPGIARVLDSGTTDEGVPYFVMEYVRGEPITTYCDRRRLAIPERLRLVAMVCEAVHHAHQKGVIHRDLKPGNLLVAEDAGQAQPKIIDFGVARAIAGHLATVPPTRTGEIVGTLLYMSPEQASPDQELDTRTDVWSLGVIAFELLVGQTPLTLRDDPASLLRFREDLTAGVVPSAPAAAARLSADEVAVRAARRSAGAAAWRRTLESDVAWILAKALEGDRNRRYASASELAHDLHQYLAGEPVSARAPSWRYLALRFVQRHRRIVLAAALTVVAIVAGAVAATIGMVSARAARDDELLARARLAAAAERQRAVGDLREFALLYGDSGLSGTAPSMRQALLAAAPMIGVRWRDRPLQQAAARAALGRALLALGEPGLAKEQLQQAWQYAGQAEADEPAWALQVLSDLRRAERQGGDAGASGRQLAHMCELAARVARPDSAALADAMTALARAAAPGAHGAATVVHDCDDAIRSLRALPLTARSFLPVGHALFAFVLTAHQDGLPGSDGLLQRMEDIARRAFGDDVEFAMVLAQLGENRLRMGHGSEALAFADELLAVLVRLDLSNHWLAAQASRLRGLALVLTGDAAAGERELVQLHERLLPFRATGNAQVRAAVGALGELARGLADHPDLAAWLEASLARWRTAARAAAMPVPWWPAMLDEQAPMPVLVEALAAVERAAVDSDAALRGALLLRLGRVAAALPWLEGAHEGAREAAPELLADLVVAQVLAGTAAPAERTLAELRRRAETATAPAARWRGALQRAESARR